LSIKKIFWLITFPPNFSIYACNLKYPTPLCKYSNEVGKVRGLPKSSFNFFFHQKKRLGQNYPESLQMRISSSGHNSSKLHFYRPSLISKLLSVQHLLAPITNLLSNTVGKKVVPTTNVDYRMGTRGMSKTKATALIIEVEN